jgi:hypothetical protein
MLTWLSPAKFDGSVTAIILPQATRGESARLYFNGLQPSTDGRGAVMKACKMLTFNLIIIIIVFLITFQIVRKTLHPYCYTTISAN